MRLTSLLGACAITASLLPAQIFSANAVTSSVTRLVPPSSQALPIGTDASDLDVSSMGVRLVGKQTVESDKLTYRLAHDCYGRGGRLIHGSTLNEFHVIRWTVTTTQSVFTIVQVDFQSAGVRGSSEFEVDVVDPFGANFVTGLNGTQTVRRSFGLFLPAGSTEILIRARTLLTMAGSHSSELVCTIAPEPMAVTAPFGTDCGLTFGMAVDGPDLRWDLSGAAPGDLVAWAAGASPPGGAIPSVPACELYASPDSVRFGVADAAGSWQGSVAVGALSGGVFYVQGFALRSAGVLASRGWTVRRG